MHRCVCVFLDNVRSKRENARLRLRCSALNEHLYAKNLVEHPSCECGAQIESVTHFLLECEQYDEDRNKLFEDLEMCTVLDTDLLLYGSEEMTLKQKETLFKAVEKYILNTKRFD